MPGKHVKKDSKRSKRSANKHSKGSADTTVSRTFATFSRDKLPFSPRFHTKMACGFVGTLPAGTAASGYFYVSGNSAHIPFSSSYVYSTRTINYYSPTGYSGEYYNTVQPEGFTAICGASTIYRNYRVHGCKITVSFNPTNAADNIYAVTTANTSGNPSTTTIWTASSAPFSSKVGTFTSVDQRRPLVKKLATAHVWGVPQLTIDTDVSFGAGYNGSPTSEWAWVIQWQTVDNTTTSAVMGIRILLEYDIEFYQPSSGGLPDVLLEQKLDTEVPVLTTDEFNSLSTKELLIRQELLRRERAHADRVKVKDNEVVLSSSAEAARKPAAH